MVQTLKVWYHFKKNYLNGENFEHDSKLSLLDEGFTTSTDPIKFKWHFQRIFFKPN